MLYLRVRAPFGAFRNFTAGSFRPTAPFVSPSAAYGLLLNLAGIESRFDDGVSVATLTQKNLPRFKLALGAISFPEPQSLYQQAHNYPVGSSGKDRQENCFGAKYNIQPVRREFLSGIDACLAVDAGPEFETALNRGLGPNGPKGLYGLPFLGDNSFLVDLLDLLEGPPQAYWYSKLAPGEMGVRDGICRLTVWIDRLDSTKTIAPLFFPAPERTNEIPVEAWVDIGPPA